MAPAISIRELPGTSGQPADEELARIRDSRRRVDAHHLAGGGGKLSGPACEGLGCAPPQGWPWRSRTRGLLHASCRMMRLMRDSGSSRLVYAIALSASCRPGRGRWRALRAGGRAVPGTAHPLRTVPVLIDARVDVFEVLKVLVRHRTVSLRARRIPLSVAEVATAEITAPVIDSDRPPGWRSLIEGDQIRKSATRVKVTAVPPICPYMYHEASPADAGTSRHTSPHVTPGCTIPVSGVQFHEAHRCVVG